MFAERKWSKLGVGFDGFGPRSRPYQNGAREGSVGATHKKARAERPQNLQSHQTSVLQVNESGFAEKHHRMGNRRVPGCSLGCRCPGAVRLSSRYKLVLRAFTGINSPVKERRL